MHLPFDSNLSFIYQQHHPHSNPEKQKLSGPVTGAGSRRMEASGGLNLFWNYQLFAFASSEDSRPVVCRTWSR